MEKEDIGLKLCSNKPIYVDEIPIYPISLKKIAEIGYKRFSAEIRLLCLTPSEVQAMTGEDISDSGIYKYIVRNVLTDPQMMDIILFWLSQITHTTVTFSVNKMCFNGKSFYITEKNFEEFQMIVRMRNGLQDVEEDDENPDNDAARRVLQRRKEERMKRRKAQSSDDESAITLADLVSILASGHGMLMDTVMEYDLYQFNDQFNRLKIMDDYEVSVQALLHGAKKESVNLIHWITKIKRDSE